MGEMLKSCLEMVKVFPKTEHFGSCALAFATGKTSFRSALLSLIRGTTPHRSKLEKY